MFLDRLLQELTIRTKDQRLEPLTPNWAQLEVLEEVARAYEEGRPARIIVLKARQLGISTISEALLYLWCLMFPNTNSCIVAHDQEASEYLFGMTKLYYEAFFLRDFIPHKYATRKQLSFEREGSNIWVMTAENVRAGRGRTIHCLHASEVAFWKEPEEVMLALNQTIPNRPGTVAILESTANGVGNYFEEAWLEAKAGRTDYIPLFFPWYKEPSYVPCEGQCASLKEPCAVCRLAAESVGPLRKDEEILLRMGATTPHIAWRRWAIANRCDGDIDRFHQEYPSTDHEAFVASGENVFPEYQLRYVYKPKNPRQGRLVRDDTSLGGVRFVPDSHGPLAVYKAPSRNKDWGHYLIGADPTHGTLRGDPAAAQVLNRRTFEQCAVWHGNIDPMTFAEELALLGSWYNMAVVAPEIEGPGYATIGRLSTIYHNIWNHRWPDKWPGEMSPSLGWSTNWKRKQWAIGMLQKLVRDRTITLHDEKTMSELRNFAFLGAQAADVYGPGSKSGHDDLVMALAIATVCTMTEGPLMPLGDAVGVPGRLSGEAEAPQEPVWQDWEGMA